MSSRVVLLTVGACVSVHACASQPPASPADPVGGASAPAATQASAPVPPTIAAAPSAQPAPAPEPSKAGQPCGDLGCRIFGSSGEALEIVLESSPRILGIGEAHALSGTEGIEPATRRFTRDLLPLLKGRVSDIVVELLIPNPKCRKEAEKARQEQKVVTEKQAATDQNDYLALGNAAKALGIRAHALEPTCDDLARIAGAGKDAVVESLNVITRVSKETLERLYQRNLSGNDPRMVLAYGGAMHNDSAPRPGREQWSFGPALQTLTGGKYADVDLIVPEFITDSPAWKSLPWVAAFNPKAHAESTTLFEPAVGSFVIVFPRSAK